MLFIVKDRRGMKFIYKIVDWGVCLRLIYFTMVTLFARSSFLFFSVYPMVDFNFLESAIGDYT